MTGLHIDEKIVRLSICQWLPCPLAIWNLLFGMAILLNLDKQMPVGNLMSDTQTDSICKRVTIINRMVCLKSLDTPEGITNCSDLAKQRHSEYDDVHFVFDGYDVAEPLKTST